MRYDAFMHAYLTTHLVFRLVSIVNDRENGRGEISAIYWCRIYRISNAHSDIHNIHNISIIAV